MSVLTGRLHPAAAAASTRSACRMGPRVKPEDDGEWEETSGKRRYVWEFQQNAQANLREKLTCHCEFPPELIKVRPI
ncbi:hypothetical protein, partial [Rhizobium sp. H4]|uniref:hypothetical protein n=1 Tax=Rhizobium sp. H4 TaxID=2035449 RepID=UPI001AED0646